MSNPDFLSDQPPIISVQISPPEAKNLRATGGRERR